MRSPIRDRVYPNVAKCTRNAECIPECTAQQHNLFLLCVYIYIYSSGCRTGTFVAVAYQAAQNRGLGMVEVLIAA